MNEAQAIMTGSNLANLAGELPEKPDVVSMAIGLSEVVAAENGLPQDFDGVSINIIRDQNTKSLKAIIISPVDVHGDEPFARYQVNPTNTIQPKQPKIILPS